MNDAWTKFLVRCIEDACRAEVCSAKPGNVGPHQHFADASVDDFLRSAEVVAPILGRSAESGVGQAVLDAALATREYAGHNTNLGIILLLAPLASVPASQSLVNGIERILEQLVRGPNASQLLLCRGVSGSANRKQYGKSTGRNA